MALSRKVGSRLADLLPLAANRFSGAARTLPAFGLIVFVISVALAQPFALSAAPAPGAKAEPLKETLPAPTQEDGRRAALPGLIAEQGRLHLRYARELRAGGRLRDALEHFDRFLALYPGHSWRFFAYRDRGRTLEQLGRAAAAIDSYRSAYLEAHNRSRAAMAFLRAGQLSAEIGKVPEARRIFTRIIGLHPASRAARLAEIELRSLRFLDAHSPRSQPERGSTGDGKPADPPPAVPSKQDDPPAGTESPVGPKSEPRTETKKTAV